MYHRYRNGDISEAEYKTYLLKQEEREFQASKRFKRTVQKLRELKE